MNRCSSFCLCSFSLIHNFASWLIDYCCYYCVWYDFSHFFICTHHAIHKQRYLYLVKGNGCVRFVIMKTTHFVCLLSIYCWLKISDRSVLKDEQKQTKKKTNRNKTKKRICLKCGNEYLFNLIKAPSDWTSKWNVSDGWCRFLFHITYTRALILITLT